MECDICMRDFGGRRQPLCASCAHARLYGPRIQQAGALLEREHSHRHADAVIRPGNDGVLAALPEDVDFDAITAGMKKHSHDRAQAERQATDNRVNLIVNKAEELRSQMQAYKSKIESQKEDIEHRRKLLANERQEHEKQKPRAIEPVETAANKASQRLDKTHNRIVDCRVLLCREAALSSNLQRRKNAKGRSEYTLGGIVIPDLRELNIRTQPSNKATAVGGRTVAEPHDLVSEALDNVARLVNLTAHYLSVRLPAEIILPHEDFPRAVIMTDKSSYKHKNVPFPGISGSQSSSPAASRIIDQNQPRPRMLCLDRPLSQLVKDDPKAYGLFIEGVTLLAWNIAWLCKTQGLESITTFEDMCSMGKNLYQLLVSPSRKSQQKGADQEEKVKENRLGVFSHGTARHNLASSEGLDLFKEWKMPSTSRLADKLRSYLLAEISGAEWDLLEEREWDEEREDEKPVLVGGSRRPQESKHVAMSVMTVAPLDDNDASDGKQKGNNGWMKVRGRNQAP
ncbi:hypothetical protein PRZ48_009765 [Zasmidium cellare]|uniref:Autophagy-related protein 14 n=1 Tax=Zasmidium cellare TaxID=395010 RepID=A0ABR0ECR7_ZASCE|nr:hypothetical protein PRZ48_009765 [Zasmidium cellare]